VTAERLEQPAEESTAAVTVLRGDELQRLPAQNLGDALRLVPGLQLIAVNPGAPPMISSRGFFGAGEVEYLQLRIDGIAVGDAESGLADWRSVPLQSIERIEVMRGAGSSLFGDTALGGVVQVFRRETSHASLSAGNLGTLRWTGSYASHGLSIGANVSRSDGFRAHSAHEERFAHGAFERGRMRVSLDASQREREDPGPLGAEELYRDDREDSQRARAALRYRDESFEALLHAHDRDTQQVRTLLLAPGFGDRATRGLDAQGIGAEAIKTFTLRNGRIATGADVGYESLESEYSTDINRTHLERRALSPSSPFGGPRARRSSDGGDGTRRSAALFASGEWRVTPSLRLAAGGRFDALDDDFASAAAHDHAFSPRLGASYDLGDVTAYVQLARAFKAPTLDQRFDVRELAGAFTISNPDLVPQRSRNVELGARGKAWEVVAYTTDVDDEIDFDVRTFRYANIGRSRHRGVETMFALRPATLMYTWTRVEPLEGEHRGNQLKNIAEHVARLDVDLRTRVKVDVHVAVEYSASRYLDDANAFPLDDAVVVDVRFARAFGAFTAAIDARNLFDRDYAPLGFALDDVPFFYPAEGRSLAFTLSWHATKGDSQ